MKGLHREAWFWLAGGAMMLAFLGVAAFWPFPAMTTLAIAAAVIRGALVLFLFAMVVGLAGKLAYVERAGLGLAMGCMLMTTQSLLVPHTPWEAWASIGSGLGFMIYFGYKSGPELWRKIASIGDPRERWHG